MNDLNEVFLKRKCAQTPKVQCKKEDVNYFLDFM